MKRYVFYIVISVSLMQGQTKAPVSAPSTVEKVSDADLKLVFDKATEAKDQVAAMQIIQAARYSKSALEGDLVKKYKAVFGESPDVPSAEIISDLRAVVNANKVEIEKLKTTLSECQTKHGVLEQSCKNERTENDSLKNELKQMKDREAQRLADEKKQEEQRQKTMKDITELFAPRK